METEYLKKCFGNSLSQALAEVAKVRPSDPIEYLARWLYHYRKIALEHEKNMQEQIQLKEEYENSLKEMEMAAMMKQEELQIQEKCEACQKKLSYLSLSKKKVSFKEEDTDPFEEKGWQPEPQRGAASRIPAKPNQSPLSELTEESEQNLESP